MTTSLETQLALYTPGTRVWTPHAEEGWVGAVVTKFHRNEEDITIVLADEEKGNEITKSTTLSKLSSSKEWISELPPLRNPPILEGIEDLTSLSYLHEPAVLHNIRTRYGRHNIYTYSGIVLIAMNPFQKVSQLYTSDVVKAYSGKRRGELEPHLFAVTEDAFRGMIRERKNQSIIVSGESGAGKTVSAKYIMRYFATADSGDKSRELDSSQRTISDLDVVLSPSGDPMGGAAGMSEVEQQVLATNPIMESFGNAKTTRNDNSSRFGKYIELLFDTKAKIVGARLRTYLLERSRVVFQPETERNYHVFYQLCAGAPAAEKKELGLHSHTQFNYLNRGGGTGIVPGVDDSSEFELTQRALSTIGVSVSAQWYIFRLLAALLHIGNINIIGARSGEEASIADDDPSTLIVCRLLGLQVNDFRKWLTTKQITTRNETIVSKLSPIQSGTTRDAVAKFLYAGLFEWLVERINDSLCPDEIANTFSNFIGVLDIYGFEHFKKNSFEQFCMYVGSCKLAWMHTFILKFSTF
jgi:myosin-5